MTMLECSKCHQLKMSQVESEDFEMCIDCFHLEMIVDKEI